MIQRVYEQAMHATRLSKVIVATDDPRIYEHVKKFGAEVVMTRSDHQSGTDRCFEALNNLKENKLNGKFSHLINIQGDEPFIDPTQIDLLAEVISERDTELATLVIPVSSSDLLFNEGEVKVVVNKNMEALYFSRSVIPHLKGIEPKDWHKNFVYYRHVGMYAYRSDVLEKISALTPSPLENAESLEQLRWLENGFKIKVAVTDHESHCIDTPEDIQKILKLLSI